MGDVRKLEPPRVEVALVEFRRDGGPRIVGRSDDPALLRLARIKVRAAERRRREREALFWSHPAVSGVWQAILDDELDAELADPDLGSRRHEREEGAADREIALELEAAEREEGAEPKGKRP